MCVAAIHNHAGNLFTNLFKKRKQNVESLSLSLILIYSSDSIKCRASSS